MFFTRASISATWSPPTRLSAPRLLPRLAASCSVTTPMLICVAVRPRAVTGAPPAATGGCAPDTAGPMAAPVVVDPPVVELALPTDVWADGDSGPPLAVAPPGPRPLPDCGPVAVVTAPRSLAG